jgi:ABC-type sugar transport system ATPase subunit
MIVASPESVALQCIDVSKTYGRTQVLAPANLSFAAGAVHALVGANGAGKSTLLGTLSGRVTPTTGTVRFEGRELPFGNPRKIRKHGVAAVYQELETIPGLSALANVFLGTERHRGWLLSERAMRSEYRKLCERLQVDIPPGARAGNLSVAQQQSLEIMRALRSKARLLLFDEPTASLALPERRTLLSVLRGLADSGLTLAFVSHQLDEVLQISDTITVLRNGVVVAQGTGAEFTKERLIRDMAGAPVVKADADLVAGRAKVTAGAETIVVDDLNLPGRVDGVSITVQPGEVVGLAGLVGAGRSSILRSLGGAESRAVGSMVVGGRRQRVPRSIHAARKLGIVLMPEDRKVEGLVGERSVEDNIALSSYSGLARWGFVNGRKQRALADNWRSRVHLTAYRPGVRARMLSGGNQQKVLLARVLQVQPTLILADEPTRGVDVAAKEQVLATLRTFADNGGAVILTSSEIEEVLSVSDRIYVISGGRVVHEIDDVRPDITVESVLRHAFGSADA